MDTLTLTIPSRTAMARKLAEAFRSYGVELRHAEATRVLATVLGENEHTLAAKLDQTRASPGNAFMREGRGLEQARLLQALVKARLELAVQVPALGGVRTCVATAEQALRLLEDKDAVYGELVGLSKPDYIEWQSSNGSVYCCARTKAGKQCRNPVSGGTWLEPAAWKALHDAKGYCAIHGG